MQQPPYRSLTQAGVHDGAASQNERRHCCEVEGRKNEEATPPGQAPQGKSGHIDARQTQHSVCNRPEIMPDNCDNAQDRNELPHPGFPTSVDCQVDGPPAIWQTGLRAKMVIADWKGQACALGLAAYHDNEVPRRSKRLTGIWPQCPRNLRPQNRTLLLARWWWSPDSLGERASVVPRRLPCRPGRYKPMPDSASCNMVWRCDRRRSRTRCYRRPSIVWPDARPRHRFRCKDRAGRWVQFRALRAP